MGRDKASLPFGPEQMLQRVVRLIGEVVPAEHTVVVAAVNQELPPLPPRILIVRDQDEYRGPLAGLATGFPRSPGTRRSMPYLPALCDVPLLLPAFVQRMFDLLDTYDAVVPVDGVYHHALSAAYRPNVLPEVERLLRAIACVLHFCSKRCARVKCQSISYAKLILVSTRWPTSIRRRIT